MPAEHTPEELYARCRKLLRLKEGNKASFEIMRRSIDARKKDRIRYVYTVDLLTDAHVAENPGKNIRRVPFVSYNPRIAHFADAGASVTPSDSVLEDAANRPRTAVIGAGPSGLFCAYLLARNGLKPVVFERGRTIRERDRDIERFWKNGILTPSSNVQFGEGGAGTYSDGKLHTQIRDKDGKNRFILQTFTECGAPEEILYDAYPHIGTDLLKTVIENLRKRITDLGGSFYFETQVTGICQKDGHLSGLILNDETEIAATDAALCIGHSARDTFQMLYESGVRMERKPFAVGFRMEHPQRMIDIAQYGNSFADRLPHANYRLTHQTGDGRGVYSFCMCPGGYVVNASSETGRLAVNGMSYHARSSGNANAAIVVTVKPQDFPESHGPLGGVLFQKQLEEKAYQLADGAIPQQLFGDFISRTVSRSFGGFESCTKGAAAFADLSGLLPESFNDALIAAVTSWGRKIQGFSRPDAVFSGIESRTSSPVRILRDHMFTSSVPGLYPCGEGAGYAGGITSAAADGLRVAEAIIKKEMSCRS